MKFLVDELPYYEGFCPFVEKCGADVRLGKCPRYWDKDKVCSDDNQHECRLLIEMDPAQESNRSDDRCCRTCRHFGDLDMTSSCAPCYGYSNWEAKDV